MQMLRLSSRYRQVAINPSPSQLANLQTLSSSASVRLKTVINLVEEAKNLIHHRAHRETSTSKKVETPLAPTTLNGKNSME